MMGETHPGSSPSRHFPVTAVVVILTSVVFLLLLLLLVHLLLQRSSDDIELELNLKHLTPVRPHTTTTTVYESSQIKKKLK